MKKALIVARWEYIEKVKSKTFLIGIFVTPLLMVVMGILPGLFASKEDASTRAIGLIDMTGEFAGEFKKRMEENYVLEDKSPNYIVEILTGNRDLDLAGTLIIAEAKVLGDELEGYCIIRSTEVTDSLVEYRSKNVGDFRLSTRIDETLGDIIMERKLLALGLEPSLMKDLAVRIRTKTVKISEGTSEESGFLQVFFRAYAVMMMLFFVILTSGQMLVRSVLEEKANRIVEILVSSCSSTELMAGKVLGLSGLAITQVAVWGLIATALAINLNFQFVDLGQAVLLFVYFLLGYLFYAAIFIGFGAPVTTEQEAQQITSYLVFLVILPIVIAIPAIQNPNAAWLQILSFVPFLTPTMMALRITILTPSPWEIIGTIIILLISTLGAMWVAGRIFRIAILATGTRPGLREMFRWIRAN
ncbi:MAG TPA: ABC transporter permease [Bacteroidota bacterium]